MNLIELKALLLKYKWVIVSVLFISLLAIFLLGSTVKKPETLEKKTDNIQPRKAIPSLVSSVQNGIPVAINTFTPEQLKQIEQQRQADEEVGKREVAIRNKYPWFIFLPLKSDKYFVYFEPNSETFTGLLYTTVWDDVDKLKSEIIKKLKDLHSIQTENYKFEWKVNPK